MGEKREAKADISLKKFAKFQENSLNWNSNRQCKCRIERNSIGDSRPSENVRQKKDISKKKFVIITTKFHNLTRENLLEFEFE